MALAKCEKLRRSAVKDAESKAESNIRDARERILEEARLRAKAHEETAERALKLRIRDELSGMVLQARSSLEVGAKY